MNEQELRDQLTSNWGQMKAKEYLAKKQMQKIAREERISDVIQSVAFIIVLFVCVYVVLAL